MKKNDGGANPVIIFFDLKPFKAVLRHPNALCG